MRIYLVGFMGAGKTTVGRSLAETLGASFLDLDSEVEKRSGRTVAELFREEGEASFRQLEREVLVATAESDDVVVATGGGVMESEENRRFIRQHGVSVWLCPELSTLIERAREAPGSQRPLFVDEERFRSLYRGRVAQYRLADFEVQVAVGDRPDATVDSVRRRLEERS